MHEFHFFSSDPLLYLCVCFVWSSYPFVLCIPWCYFQSMQCIFKRILMAHTATKSPTRSCYVLLYIPPALAELSVREDNTRRNSVRIIASTYICITLNLQIQKINPKSGFVANVIRNPTVESRHVISISQ